MVNSTFIKLMIKAQLATFGFLLILFMFTGLVLGIIGWHHFSSFQKSSHMSIRALASLVQTSWENPPLNSNGFTTILILGLDEVAARKQTALTDTVLLASINSHSGRINLLSLPRDLWVPKFQTKINALYFYSQKNNPDQPTTFVAQAIEDITGASIDYVVPVTLEQLSAIVDTLGGLEVDVPQAFIDEHFPRPNIDPSQETNVTVLQETVSFEKGLQTMNGARVLEYVRSRKSEGDTGTDDSRAQRQQQVFLALFKKLQSREIVTNSKLVGALVNWYTENYEQSWPLVDLLSVGFELARNEAKPSIVTHSLSVAPPNTTNGDLIHPPVWRYQNQWVYIATDSAIFKETIQQILYK